MLVVIAQLFGRSEHRDAISSGLAELAAASRGEDGCLSYSFAVDVENPDRYLSVETWTEQAALDAHNGTPHLAALLQKAAGWFTAAPVIDVHEVN